MGTLARTFPPERRNRVMGAWGAANGIGQAIGPPVGGFVADAFGWRAIFGRLVPVTVGVLVLTLRVVPRDSGQRHPDRLGRRGLADRRGRPADDRGHRGAAARRPRRGCPPSACVLGVAALVGFVLSGLRRAHPFIDPRLLVEIRWLRSATGVFVQQCTLAAVLVGGAALPDRRRRPVGLGDRTAVFSLPLVWAVLAPLVGLLADRIGPRPVLRTGLGAARCSSTSGSAVVLGSGRAAPAADDRPAASRPAPAIALVQTPALTGATRSPAGQRGAGLGLFNMMRFVGRRRRAPPRVAAAWPDGLVWLFGGCAAVAVGGLVLSFLGREMPDAPSAPAGQSGLTTRSTSAVVVDSRSRVCASHTANWLSACRRSMPSSREARSSL